MKSIATRPAKTGVLLIDKPRGVTSHDVVGRVRRIFGQREVGHTGTLDPMATGLLVLGLGRATRIARFIEAAEKRYTGTITLGRATTTFDAEGDTTAVAEVSGLDEGRVREALARLVGVRAQRVPAFSAVKVGGERLYSRARRGEAVEAPERVVTIHALELTRFAPPELDVVARVSKGTYIRTLAVEVGAGLGLPAHLTGLRRTHVGQHRVEAARSLEALTGDPGELIPMTDALGHLPRVSLAGPVARDVCYGRVLVAGVLRNSGSDLSAYGRDDPVLLMDGEALLAIGVATLGSAEVAGAPAEARAFSYACVLAPDAR